MGIVVGINEAVLKMFRVAVSFGRPRDEADERGYQYATLVLTDVPEATNYGGGQTDGPCEKTKFDVVVVSGSLQHGRHNEEAARGQALYFRRAPKSTSASTSKSLPPDSIPFHLVSSSSLSLSSVSVS